MPTRRSGGPRGVGLGLVALLAATPALAQRPAGAAAGPLHRAIQALADYDNAATPDLNIDSVATATARQAARYLQSHALTAAQAGALGLPLSVDSQDAAHLRVYTFGYTSGGTRGAVSVAVVQWRDAAGQLEAYPLPVACGFSEIYKLASPGRTLYLLLGTERLNAPSVLSQALVLELKGKYLRLDNAVFGAGPLLPLSNTDMEFDPARQTLHLDLTNYAPEQQGEDPLLTCGYHGSPASRQLTLRFSNGRFVKSR